MAWPTALQDLRTKLSDNSADRLRAFKRVFGDINGSNTIFKTFEYRRVTDFTSATGFLGVYKNGTRLNNSSIVLDDTSTGYFQLAASAAPSGSDVIESTYYSQYFTDAELTGFLRLASNFLALGDDYTQIPGGLQSGALNYAAAEGYQKLAMRFADKMSDVYRLNDLPDEDREKIIIQFKKSSEDARTEAIKLRDDYYLNRQGQALAPLYGFATGCVFDVPPNR